MGLRKTDNDINLQIYNFYSCPDEQQEAAAYGPWLFVRNVADLWYVWRQETI